MRIRKYFLPLFFIAITVFLLHACNFGASKSDSNLVPALPSETQVVPTDTATFISMPTAMKTFTPSLTLVPSATFTPSLTPLPSPTVPTLTPTLQWSACPGIVITVTDTDAGDMLHVLRCEDGWEHDFGPLAKGQYAVGPNDKFLVYVTVGGIVYAARMGDPNMVTLFNLETEHEFTVFSKKVAPDFKISFIGEAPSYRLVLVEKRYDQKRVYDLQPRLTQ
jgi:hypothetical protein